MQRIIHVLMVVTSTTAVTACALDGQDEQGAQSTQLAPEESAAEVAHTTPDTAATTPSVTPDAFRAATTSGPCPQGSVCLYQNGHQTGAAVFVTAGISIANLGTISCPACTNGVNGSNGTFNDQMSSWKNASSMNYCWFPNTNFTGATHLMLAGSMNTLPAEYNDHASSLRAGNCP